MAEQPNQNDIHPTERIKKDRAAIVEVMMELQAKRGFLDDQDVIEAARRTGLSPTEVEELASFYTLIYRRPVGRRVLLVCDSVCCAMNGSERLLNTLERRLGIALGEVSRDGAVTVLPSICLGLCDRAPAALLNGEALGPLDDARLDALLLELKRSR